MPKMKANISIWNGPILGWQAESITMDTDGELHGECTFVLNPELYNQTIENALRRVYSMNQTGIHEFLGWSPIEISGVFYHGQLNGVVSILTWKKQVIFFTFKHGVLHGPCYGQGIVPIYNMEVSLLSLKLRTVHCSGQKSTINLFVLKVIFKFLRGVFKATKNYFGNFSCLQCAKKGILLSMAFLSCLGG